MADDLAELRAALRKVPKGGNGKSTPPPVPNLPALVRRSPVPEDPEWIRTFLQPGVVPINLKTYSRTAPPGKISALQQVLGQAAYACLNVVEAPAERPGDEMETWQAQAHALAILIALGRCEDLRAPDCIKAEQLVLWRLQGYDQKPD